MDGHTPWEPGLAHGLWSGHPKTKPWTLQAKTLPKLNLFGPLLVGNRYCCIRYRSCFIQNWCNNVATNMVTPFLGAITPKRAHISSRWNWVPLSPLMHPHYPQGTHVRDALVSLLDDVGLPWVVPNDTGNDPSASEGGHPNWTEQKLHDCSGEVHFLNLSSQTPNSGSGLDLFQMKELFFNFNRFHSTLPKHRHSSCTIVISGLRENIWQKFQNVNLYCLYRFVDCLQ